MADVADRTRALARAVIVGAGAALLLAVVFSALQWPNMHGDSFGALNNALGGLKVLLALTDKRK